MSKLSIIELELESKRVLTEKIINSIKYILEFRDILEQYEQLLPKSLAPVSIWTSWITEGCLRAEFAIKLNEKPNQEEVIDTYVLLMHEQGFAPIGSPIGGYKLYYQLDTHNALIRDDKRLKIRCTFFDYEPRDAYVKKVEITRKETMYEVSC